MRIKKFIVFAVMAFTSCALGESSVAVPNAREIVERSLLALGVGRDVRSVKSLKTFARIVTYDIHENDHPGPPWYVAADEVITIDDFVNHRMLTERDPRLNSGADARRDRVLLTRDIMDSDAAIGYFQEFTLRGTTAPPSWETNNPIRTLRMAEVAHDLKFEHPFSLHQHVQTVLSFRNGKYPVKLYIDSMTNLPTAVETTVEYSGITADDVAWNSWGDVVQRTEYMDWRPVGGVRYPFQLDTFQNDDLYHTIRISRALLDVPISESDFTVSSEALKDVAAYSEVGVHRLQLGQPIVHAPAPARSISEIAPGIIQIPGSWYVTLVRQPDGVVIIDAPISAEYSKQVLAEAERRFPGVPVKALISSTGFLWHVAGVREYAARGIPVYVRDRNVSLIKKMMSAPHTLVPDDLARSYKKPIIRPVIGRIVLGSGHNAVVVMPVRRGTEDMLMTYLRDSRILHTAEMVQPLGPGGALLTPESLIEIKQSVIDERLDVETIIGMHMNPTAWSAVDAAIEAIESKRY